MLNIVLVLVVVTSVLGPVLTQRFLHALAPGADARAGRKASSDG